MLKVLGFLSVICLFASCDCMQQVSGVVVDVETQQPIDSAFAFMQTKKQVNAFTDSTGRFELVNVSGGLTRCPPMIFEIQKPGYQHQTVKIHNGGSSVIELKRQ